MKPEVLVPLAIIVLLALLMHWIPLWRRRNLWFGVTVSEDFRSTAEGRRVLHWFRLHIWALSALAVVLTAFAGLLAAPWLLPAAVLLQALGASVLFALARRQVLPYAVTPPSTRVASLSAIDEDLPGGAASAIVPFSILAAAALYLQANWSKMPERFPVHWGFSGQPDRWATKSWQTAAMPLIAGALLVVLMLLLGWAISRTSPRARVPGTGGWTERFRRANLRLIVAIACCLSLMLAAISVAPLFGGRTFAFVWIPLAAMFACILGFGWKIVRISLEPGSGSDGTPDQCWKFGQIYYNPGDPALMVEKRFGFGYTLNLGNPTAWWLIALLVAIIAVLVLL